MVIRRLPIFFVLDVSESMVGDSHARLEEGLGRVVMHLRTDPYALETAFLSVIVFAGKAKTLQPLTELVDFNAPALPVGGGTALGAALDHLMNELDASVVRSSADRKGDWRPIVFLMTDGHPTDDAAPAIRRWQERWRGRAHLVAISVGDAADARLLAGFADDVLILEDVGEAGFAGCIKWITQSISANSRPMEGGSGEFRPTELGAALTKFDVGKGPPPGSRIDDRFAVFTGRCQRSRAPYLLKFEQIASGPTAGRFEPAGGYTLAESFFELSDASAPAATLSDRDLTDYPPCPNCGSLYSLSKCSCGQVHCTDGPGVYTCPWCAVTSTYETTESLSFDRGRG
ncbi:MAG: hypothetical protein JWM87_1409 [Candidatus Eremiobacteraeota bacterium]|nr:hypothetical protein [Candidatus Eremiobacteraeota bacterium]